MSSNLQRREPTGHDVMDGTCGACRQAGRVQGRADRCIAHGQVRMNESGTYLKSSEAGSALVCLPHIEHTAIQATSPETAFWGVAARDRSCLRMACSAKASASRASRALS